MYDSFLVDIDFNYNLKHIRFRPGDLVIVMTEAVLISMLADGAAFPDITHLIIVSSMSSHY